MVGDKPCPPLWVLDAGFSRSLGARPFAEMGLPPLWHAAGGGDSSWLAVQKPPLGQQLKL